MLPVVFGSLSSTGSICRRRRRQSSAEGPERPCPLANAEREAESSRSERRYRGGIQAPIVGWRTTISVRDSSRRQPLPSTPRRSLNPCRSFNSCRSRVIAAIFNYSRPNLRLLRPYQPAATSSFLHFPVSIVQWFMFGHPWVSIDSYGCLFRAASRRASCALIHFVRSLSSDFSACAFTLRRQLVLSALYSATVGARSAISAVTD